MVIILNCIQAIAYSFNLGYELGYCMPKIMKISEVVCYKTVECLL
jgi:hypothetical protein